MIRTRLVPLALLMATVTFGEAWAQAPADPSVEGDEAAVAPPAAAAPAVEPPTGDDRPLARLLPNLGHDLIHFPSVGTAVVMGVGGAVSLAVTNSDGYLSDHAAAGGTDPVFAVGGVVGNGWVQGGIALGTYAAGRLSHSTRTAHLGSDLIRGQLLVTVLTSSIKLAAGRSRPADQDTGHAGTNSFPSGHSASTWTTSTVLWRHLGWKVGAPASLVAAYLSASRVQQRQHYMSDVIFGAALGIASGHTVTLGHGARRFTIAPVPVPGGGAVVLSAAP
jgi:hypothetical protein